MRTGREKWRWDPEIPDGSAHLCCGPVNRGVAVSGGKVYAGLIDGRLVALDRETGKLLWTTQTAEPGSDVTLTGAVRVIKGKVIVGSAGGEYAVRGFSRPTTRKPENSLGVFTLFPEILRKASSTPSSKWPRKPGTDAGGRWAAAARSGAYDAGEDLLYVGTGNGGPWNQAYRSPGGGDNLFLSSILEAGHRPARVALPDDARRDVGLRRYTESDPG